MSDYINIQAVIILLWVYMLGCHLKLTVEYDSIHFVLYVALFARTFVLCTCMAGYQNLLIRI